MSRSNPTVALDVKVGECTLLLKGREAWALQQLLERGEKGVTPITNPAPRWSHYIFQLRGYGLEIETVREEHGGPFAGHHARYVLRSPVDVLQQKVAG